MMIPEKKFPQILALGGFNLQQTAQGVRTHYEKVINPILPPRLKLGHYTVDERKAESSVLVTYSAYDPLEVPQPVLDVLHYFDGRPVATVLAAIAEEKHLALDDSLLLALVDFEVLETMDEPGDKPPPKVAREERM